MNKTELVDAVAGEMNLPKATAMRALDTMLNKITEALCQDGTVALLGFGSFNVRVRPARKGRNPRTGEMIDIKASKIVSFKPGKALKEAIAEKV